MDGVKGTKLMKGEDTTDTTDTTGIHMYSAERSET